MAKLEIIKFHQKLLKNKLQEFTIDKSNTNFFRIIFENAAVGIAIADMQGHPIIVNDTFKKMIGYSDSELHKKTFENFTHPQDLNLDRELFQKMKKGKIEKYFLEKRYINNKNQIVWVEVSVSLIRDLNGNPKYTIGMINNITKRKKVEEEFLDAKNFLEVVLENIVDGVMAYDKNGKLVYANQKAAKLMMCENQEELYKIKELSDLKCKSWKRYLLQDDNKNNFPCEQMSAKRALSGNNLTEETVYIFDRLKNKGFWMQTRAMPILDKDGKVEMVIRVFNNVTAKKELEMRKDEFIGVVSHELKNPLTSIKVFTQLLQRKFATLPNHKEENHLLNRMIYQEEKIIQMVKDLLDVNKIEKENLELNIKKFSFDKFVKETIEDIQKTMETKHQIFIKGKTGALLKGDKDRLDQVVVNLIANAIKYSPESDKVLVTLGKEENFIKMSIKDFGIGISTEDQRNIFGRFFRAKAVKEGQATTGLGLGLYIAAGIIKAHGGKIEVKSRLHKGSTFTFYLPLKINKNTYRKIYNELASDQFLAKLQN